MTKKFMLAFLMLSLAYAQELTTHSPTTA